MKKLLVILTLLSAAPVYAADPQPQSSWRQPGTLLGITACVGVLIGLWKYCSLPKNDVQTSSKIPTLTQFTSISCGSAKGFDKPVPFDNGNLSDESYMCLTPQIARMTSLAQGIKDAAANDMPLRHYLFYGPPGTGKTMLVRAFVQETGLDYIAFSANELERCTLEKGIRQVKDLFEFAQSYPKKLAIVIDDGATIFADRGTCSDKMRTLLSVILTYMGTEQSNYMVISITNRPKRFDSAALNRFGEKIRIGAPGLEERKKLFKWFIQNCFVGSPVLLEDVDTEATCNEFAQRSEGLVAGDISDVMVEAQYHAYGTENKTINSEMIFTALENKKQRMADILRDFE